MEIRIKLHDPESQEEFDKAMLLIKALRYSTSYNLKTSEFADVIKDVQFLASERNFFKYINLIKKGKELK